MNTLKNFILFILVKNKYFRIYETYWEVTKPMYDVLIQHTTLKACAVPLSVRSFSTAAS
jgi:hypothetical protein